MALCLMAVRDSLSNTLPAVNLGPLYRTGPKEPKSSCFAGCCAGGNRSTGIHGNSSRAKLCARGANLSGTPKGTLELFRGSVTCGHLSSEGFTCFEFRNENTDPRKVIFSVDITTEEATEALRCFAQQLPELTGLAHRLHQPKVAHSWPRAPQFRVCTECRRHNQ